MHRTALRVGSTLAPDLAGAWAERLFLTPPAARAARSFGPAGARGGVHLHRGRHIALWEWGAVGAPAVLLAHGWGGRASDMHPLVRPLLAAGFRVVAYDQPAHGQSSGRLSGLPDFIDVLASVARAAGGAHAVVAHSLGAAALAVAHARGLTLEAAVLISPPADLLGYSRRFARWHWMPESLRAAMQAATEERFGVPWSELDIARISARLGARALVVHDADDRLVPPRQGAAVARAWPGARLLATRGLGHRRVLADDQVVQAATQFIAGRSGVAPPARPALPDPAPLY